MASRSLIKFLGISEGAAIISYVLVPGEGRGFTLTNIVVAGFSGMKLEGETESNL